MSLRSMSALLLRRCLGRGLHDDVAAVGAGHGALHEQQPALGIDPHHRELLYGALDVPVLTRHPLARKHATGILGHADRARRVVRQRIAMRGAIRAEVMTADHARKPATLGRTRYVDELTHGEGVDADVLADLEVREIVLLDGEFLQELARFHARLGEMAGLRLADAAGATPAVGHLHCGVAVRVRLLDLRDPMFATSSTVTGTAEPSSVNTRVMPTFRPNSP